MKTATKMFVRDKTVKTAIETAAVGSESVERHPYSANLISSPQNYANIVQLTNDTSSFHAQNVTSSILYQYFALVALVLGSNNTMKCYGSLGCLEITEDWYGMTRPVNVLPEDRHVINTQFILRTRKSKNKPPQSLNVSQPASISKSTFDGSKPTKMIIHGFLDTGFVPWVVELSHLLLTEGDFNVIAVDWGGGSVRLYSQSAGNTRLVGLEVAALIQHLIINHGARIRDFHIIGHSLGSHIAGYAGDQLMVVGRGRIGRISALDPAEPLFQHMPEFVRLDPGDAEFVDVIHSDAKSIFMGGYGMEQACGHVDFYPNGGTDQPGCSLFDVPFSLDGVGVVASNSTAQDAIGRHLVACSHQRSVDIYMDSLRTHPGSCVMVGYECTSYEDFKQARCFHCGENDEHCAYVGYRAISYKPMSRQLGRENVKFYFNTGKKAPYCQYHYLLTLNLARPPVAEIWVQGFLKVNLYGTENEITDFDLTPERIQMAHGNSLTFWIESALDLGINVEKVEVFWYYYSDYMNPNTYCLWSCNDQLYVANVTLSNITVMEGGPKEDKTVICGDSPNGYSSINSGEWKLFYKEC